MFKDISAKVLIAILVLSFFFRFYNLAKFQFWFSDDEVNAMVVRKMVVEKRPVFISPNSTTGLTLGPYFHIMSVPLFYFAQLNPEKILAVMGILGVITTYIVYLIGKAAGNAKIGLVSAFLYGTSFVMALYDRRWWTLSVSPILTAISIYSILQIKVYKKYLWSVPLVACMSFAFHADPTIGVITFAALIAFLVLKIPVLKKEYLLALVMVLVFAAPLAFFELKHPGSVTRPIQASLAKNTPPVGGYVKVIGDLLTRSEIVFSNSILPTRTNFAEVYVASGFSGFHNLFGPAAAVIILFLVLFPVFKFSSFDAKEKGLVLVLYSFLMAFMVGIFMYAVFYKKPVWQHYYTIVFPAFLLLCGFSISKAFKNRILFAAVVFLVFAANAIALLGSSFKYPLYQKRQLVSDLSAQIGSSDFSLYQVGDAYFVGGGFPILFNFENKFPKRSNAYDFYDWMYRAHGLYTVEPTNIDPGRIIVISKDYLQYPDDKVIYREKVGSMNSVILDNSSGWYKRD